MDQIDFGFIGRNGFTIYRMCFTRYVNARWILNKPESEWSKLIPKLEETFFWLVEEGKKNGFDTKKILQIPSSSGSTCFSVAS